MSCGRKWRNADRGTPVTIPLFVICTFVIESIKIFAENNLDREEFEF